METKNEPGKIIDHRPTVKQRKFICPECGYFRMLNKGTELSLCQNCNNKQMVPESKLTEEEKQEWLSDGTTSGSSSRQQQL